MLKINALETYFIATSNHHPGGFRNVFLSGNLTETTRITDVPLKNYFAFFNYDYKNEIEALITKKKSKLGFPQHCFFEIKEKINFNSLDEFLKPENYPHQKIEITAQTSKENYIKSVSELKTHIQNGDIYEINYCITFEAENIKIDPINIFNKLNTISKAPYASFLKIKDKYIISASPELFLSKKENKLITKPIKGTAKRGANPKEDEKLKTDLFKSVKERTENVMIVDVARNDFSRIAKKGTVTVEKLFAIETYEQVHQMVSTVSCELKDGVTIKNIINATFPMASMTGAPKIRAMQLIDEFETNARGPYSGCMGYIDEKGDFDLSVLIRSIFYNASEKYLSFSVGSAITAQCDPEQECEECLLKAAALKKVLEE